MLLKCTIYVVFCRIGINYYIMIMKTLHIIIKYFTGNLLMIILLNNMMSFAMPVSDKKTQEDAILYEYTDGNTEPVVFTMDLFNENFPTDVTKNNHDLEVTMASWALVKAGCGSSQYWTNEGSLEQQFRCHALGEIWYPGEVGDWDLEPIRPDVGLIEFAINKCTPTG